MLELKNISASYGPIKALDNVNLVVNQGEVVTLIGSNGAGKSTTLRTISGMVKNRTGSILLEGREMVRLPPETVVGAGISHVPEGRRIFPRLTVEENLLAGAYLVKDPRLVAQRMEMGFSLFPRLAERRHQKGGTLSGGGAADAGHRPGPHAGPPDPSSG